MNKEQILKHKSVMEWFIENPDRGVKCRLLNNRGWTTVYEPEFSVSLIYVQNDKYSELRMAKADGKTIETLTREITWREYTVDYFRGEVGAYRVKPDESRPPEYAMTLKDT